MADTYSKDPKQRREIESARKYNINWDSQRFDLLRKNMNEMLLKYPLKYPGTNYLAALNYTTNRIIGYKLPKIYGNPESFMLYNPTSPYTKKAYEYMKKHAGFFKKLEVPLSWAFKTVADFDGLTFGSPNAPRIYINDGQSGIIAHEFWHSGTQKATDVDAYDGGSYKSNPHHFAVVKYLKQDPYIKHLLTTKRLNWDKPVTETGIDIPNYVWNPDEVLARRASLMHYLNWNPTKKATLKDVREWRRKGLLGYGQEYIKNNPIFYNTPYVDFDKLSDETILHLINDVAFNNTVPSLDTLISDVYYARKGGLIKIRKK